MNNLFFSGAAHCKLHVNACPKCVTTPLFLAFDFVRKTTNENNLCHMHSGASCTLDYCIHFRCVGETCSTCFSQYVQLDSSVCCVPWILRRSTPIPQSSICVASLSCKSANVCAPQTPNCRQKRKHPCHVEALLPLFCCCCNELTMPSPAMRAF